MAWTLHLQQNCDLYSMYYILCSIHDTFRSVNFTLYCVNLIFCNWNVYVAEWNLRFPVHILDIVAKTLHLQQNCDYCSVYYKLCVINYTFLGVIYTFCCVNWNFATEIVYVAVYIFLFAEHILHIYGGINFTFSSLMWPLQRVLQISCKSFILQNYFYVLHS